MKNIDHDSRRQAMKTIRTCALTLSMLALTSGAFAEGAGVQTAPGASHGPTTVNPSGPGRSGSDAGAAAGMGQAAHGGSGNGTSASGMGTTQGSGGMQPRLDKNGNGGNSERRSTGTNGGAQGL
jgi:hypothetical protein